MDWSNLPPEILSLIFSFGTLRSVISSTLVCSNWRGSVNDPGLWKSIYFASTPSPAYRSDAKLDWKQLVLRKFIFKYNLKKSRCVVKTLSMDAAVAKHNNGSFYGRHYACGSLSGDWCTLISSGGGTHLINVVTEQAVHFPDKHIFVTTGNRLFLSVTPQPNYRGLHFVAFPDKPGEQELGTWVKLPETREVVSVVKNSDKDSPFIALCFKRGWDDWYHNTGSVFGIYNSHTMSLIMEISEHRKIRQIGLYKHYLLYYDGVYPAKVKCVDLQTGVEHVVLKDAIMVSSIASGSNRFIFFGHDKGMIVYDITTKKHHTVKIKIEPDRTIICHDTVVCANGSVVTFIDINTGKTINTINLYDEILDFSELSNGDLAVWTRVGVRIMSFQEQLLKKRVRIQGIYQLENKCHIQEETISVSNLIEFVGNKFGGLEYINSFRFAVSPTERYGIIFFLKPLGSPSKQKQLRNNYATRFLKKTTAAHGYLPFSFEQQMDHYYCRNSYSKPQFIDGHAFLYYERLIAGRWELSSPKKWPEK